LARLQIGGICIADPGRFKLESLLTHPIGYQEVRRRAGKAKSAARLTADISPSTAAHYFTGLIQDLDLAALVDVDLVAAATDNLAAEVETAQRCLRLGKPLVHAAVHGASLVAQVRWYTNANGDGPCIRCGFSRQERDHLDANTEFSCAAGVAGQRQIARTAGPPTMSTASLCSMAADLTVMAILRHALKLGNPMSDSQIEYCGYTNNTVVSPLRPRSEDCPCDHYGAWQLERSSGPLRSSSLRELVDASGLSSNGSVNGLAVQVDDRLFVELAGCPTCGQTPVRKFVMPGKEVGLCQCGKSVYAQPFFSHRLVPLAVLEDVLDKPLRLLGGGRARAVLVRGTDRSVLFVNRAVESEKVESGKGR